MSEIPKRIWITEPVEFNSCISKGGPAFDDDVEYVLARTVDVAEAQEKLNSAVMYALREGCFFPVPEPQNSASVEELKKWGAMRNLHDAIAEFNRAPKITVEVSVRQAAEEIWNRFRVYDNGETINEMQIGIFAEIISKHIRDQSTIYVERRCEYPDCKTERQTWRYCGRHYQEFSVPAASEEDCQGCGRPSGSEVHDRNSPHYSHPYWTV